MESSEERVRRAALSSWKRVELSAVSGREAQCALQHQEARKGRTVERLGPVERDEGDAWSGRRDENRRVLAAGLRRFGRLPTDDGLAGEPGNGEASGTGGGRAEEGGEEPGEGAGRRSWDSHRVWWW